MRMSLLYILPCTITLYHWLLHSMVTMMAGWSLPDIFKALTGLKVKNLLHMEYGSGTTLLSYLSQMVVRYRNVIFFLLFFALTCKLELSTTSSLNYTNRIFSKVSTAIMCTFLILSCYNTSAVIICVTVLIWWQVALLLVDTQGTGDNTRSEKLNGLIMFISLQLSSTQMLNVWKYLRVDELSSLKVS